MVHLLAFLFLTVAVVMLARQRSRRDQLVFLLRSSLSASSTPVLLCRPLHLLHGLFQSLSIPFTFSVPRFQRYPAQWHRVSGGGLLKELSGLGCLGAHLEQTSRSPVQYQLYLYVQADCELAEVQKRQDRLTALLHVPVTLERANISS